MSKKKQEQKQQEQRQEIRQLLRDAGNNGVLNKKEFQQIVDAGANVNRTLERAVANRGLTISAGLVNAYNKGAYFQPKDYYQFSAFGQPVSPIIKQIKSAGTLDPKSTLFIGSRGSTATVLPKNFATGMSNTKSPVTAPNPPTTNETTYSPEPMDVGAGGGTDSGFDSGGVSGVPDNSSIPDPRFSPGGAGYSTDGGATSFRRKRSSRALAGLTTKGPGQLRISGQSSKSSGLNIGA